MRLEALRPHRPARGRWVAAAVAGWALVLLVVSVKALAAPDAHSCYPIFANAARNWQKGADLYSPDLKPAPGLDFYRYSPLVAGLLTPLTAFPDGLGGVLWRLLNAAVLLGGLAWWLRAVPSRPVTRGQAALVFLLVLPLAVGNLNNGQANLLVLGLVLAALAAAAEEKWNGVSVCLALACLLKLYPVAVGLLLVALYPRPLAGRLLLALAAGLFAPFLLKPASYVLAQYGDWLDYLQADDRSAFPLAYCYRDFQLLCRVWLAPLSGDDYRKVQVAAGALMAAGCLAGRWAGWSRGRLLTYVMGLGTCWMTLFGPATESCTYVLIAPALAWALVEAGLGERPVWVRYWLGGTYALLVGVGAACWFPFGRDVQALGLQPLAALSLLVYLAAAPLLERQKQTLGREEEPAAAAARAA